MGNTPGGWGRGNTGSVPDDHVAFVDLPEQDHAEGDGPDPVGGFVQANELLFEGVGKKKQLVFQPERAGVGDALDEEVARVLERRQALGIGPGRRGIAGAGRAAADTHRL